MVKQKSTWYCSGCGHKQYKWSGQCPQCESWNTLKEEFEAPQQRYSRLESTKVKGSTPMKIREIPQEKTPRIVTDIDEFDRLVGGGIVPGGLVLVGGDPGIGKSTLLLQVSNALAQRGGTVLYICGEESLAQTSLRAQRLGVDSDNLFLLNETNFSQIQRNIDAIRPTVLIVDSIQIVYKSEIPSAPGSVSQVRENAMEFMHIAKNNGIATFLIGHVTKTGEIAGPRVLEHIVDTVLYFEGDKQHNYRLMRVVKNRFGPTDEIAVFQMTSKGLHEVPNPSEIFLEERRKDNAGSVIIPTIEGTRPILVEVQALVTRTAYSTPSRRCTGLDQNRLALLLAVLEKRVGFKLFTRDVFVSLAGGLRINEPAIDLGIIIAIASSFLNKAIDPKTIVVGEVGLGGEIRSVPRIASRIKEAINMGFDHTLIPSRNVKGLTKDITDNITINEIDTVEQAIRWSLHC